MIRLKMAPEKFQFLTDIPSHLAVVQFVMVDDCYCVSSAMTLRVRKEHENGLYLIRRQPDEIVGIWYPAVRVSS